MLLCTLKNENLEQVSILQNLFFKKNFPNIDIFISQSRAST